MENQQEILEQDWCHWGKCVKEGVCYVRCKGCISYKWKLSSDYEIPEILRENLYPHLKWLRGLKTGKCININNLNIERAYMTWVILSYSQLANIQIHESSLDYCGMQYANLENGKFINSKIQCTDFSNANLKNAIFSGGTIEHVIFDKANLDGCDFSNIKMRDVTFRNTGLSYVKGFSTEEKAAIIKNEKINNFNSQSRLDI